MVLGTMAPGLFALGVTLATDRERGLLELKRALPMPRGIYLAAKLAMSMLFAGTVSILLMVLAAAAGGVTWRRFSGAVCSLLAVLGVLPFCAIGLLVGSLARASAAPAVLNLIYLPMSFLSGLWVPLSFLPHGIAQLAPLWPSWHLAQIAQLAAGVDAGTGRRRTPAGARGRHGRVRRAGAARAGARRALKGARPSGSAKLPTCSSGSAELRRSQWTDQRRAGLAAVPVAVLPRVPVLARHLAPARVDLAVDDAHHAAGVSWRSTCAISPALASRR